MTDTPPPARPWCSTWLPRVAVSVWIILAIALSARPLFGKIDHTVYPDFTGAGDHWRHGVDLYVRGGEHEFRYSPLIASFFVPFSLLPARIGEFIWRLLNVITFAGGLWYAAAVGLPRKWSAVQTAAIFLLVLPMSVGSLNNAQSNPLIAGLLLMGAAAFVQRRFTLSSVAIVVATSFKLYPIVLGLLLVLRSPWRMGWRLAVGLAAVAVLPFVLQHAGYVMDQYQIWSHYLMSEDRQRGPITDWYGDLRALSRVYIAPIGARLYLLIEVSAGMLIATAVLLGQWRRWPLPMWIFFVFCLSSAWMTALGPGTESATYILLAPAIAWALIMQQPPFGSRPLRVGYTVVLGIFTASQMALWFGKPGMHFRQRLQPLPLGGTLFLLLLLIDAAMQLAKSQPSTNETS